ncbi:MAG: hypothetical protein RLZZ242_1436 [Bacteroidota bacterium]
MKTKFLIALLSTAVLATSCNSDEFDNIQSQLDSMNAKLASLETVSSKIDAISSSVSGLSNAQASTANQLQVLLNQIEILASQTTDLTEISGLLDQVSAELTTDINGAIDILGNFLGKDKTFGHRSISPEGSSFFKLSSEFSSVKISTLMTSEDVLPESPDFVYGSMADGSALLKNSDNTYTLINNIEADYSIARVVLDETLTPLRGEYILNQEATATTAMCSGSIITPKDHGFGPLYLSGGEWGAGIKQGVYAVDPMKKASQASSAKVLTQLGEWAVENAVALHKDAFPGKTVVMIGDDNSADNIPQGAFGLYVGDHGDLENGKLYGLKVPGMKYEMEMKEGETYNFEMYEFQERALAPLNQEGIDNEVMGFSRVEDIDWRRGSASNSREAYFAVTGRKKAGLKDKGTFYGRVYKIVFDASSPLKGTISPVLDGDNLTGVAKQFHSPDNILVTENYAYIQEDLNGYPDTADKSHYAYLYQYNLNTGELKVVLECDQVSAAALGYGNTSEPWEITGMIDISEEVNKKGTFLMITQNHGWSPKDGSAFSDPKAVIDIDSSLKEGSMLFLVEGLDQ